MLKKSMLSLALAGTLTASQFLSHTKEFMPQESAQKLNQEAKLIKKTKSRTLTQEQIDNIKNAVSIMMDVNNRTYSDFLPTLEASFQRWAKEDKASLSASLDIMSEFLSIRLKQYDNMVKALKGTNAPKELLSDISKMEKLSRDAKKILTQHKKNLAIFTSIEKDIMSVQGVEVESFWLPEIEEKNAVLVKVSGIKEDDFEAMDKATQTLNSRVTSEYIEAIMVA